MFTIRRLSSLLHPLSLYWNSPELYKACPEGVQPRNMENRDIYWRRHKIQETLYILQWCLNSLQSRHLRTSHSSPNGHYLPSHIFLNLWGSETSSMSKDLVLGKSISHRVSNQGWTGQTFSQTTLHDAQHVAGGVTLWWCSCQSPVAHSCSLQSHPNSLHRRMISLTWNLMQILCSIGSVTLNVMATSTHAHSGASTPPLTSAGKWSLFSHAHSSPSSLADRLHLCDTYCSYINNDWTHSTHTWYTFFQLTVLISVGFFPQNTTTLSSHQM